MPPSSVLLRSSYYMIMDRHNAYGTHHDIKNQEEHKITKCAYKTVIQRQRIKNETKQSNNNNMVTTNETYAIPATAANEKEKEFTFDIIINIIGCL